MMRWGFYTICFARLASVKRKKKNASESFSKNRSDFSSQHRDKTDVFCIVWIKKQRRRRRREKTFVPVCGGAVAVTVTLKVIQGKMKVGENNEIKEMESRWRKRREDMEEEENKGAYRAYRLMCALWGWDPILVVTHTIFITRLGQRWQSQ